MTPTAQPGVAVVALAVIASLNALAAGPGGLAAISRAAEEARATSCMCISVLAC